MSQGPLTQHMGSGDSEAGRGCEVDHEALAQGHVNVITGACMAIGIKVACSAHPTGLRLMAADLTHFLDFHAADLVHNKGQLQKEAYVKTHPEWMPRHLQAVGQVSINLRVQHTVKRGAVGWTHRLI